MCAPHPADDPRMIVKVGQIILDGAYESNEDLSDGYWNTSTMNENLSHFFDKVWEYVYDFINEGDIYVWRGQDD